MKQFDWAITDPSQTVLIEMCSNGAMITTFEDFGESSTEYIPRRGLFEIPDKEENMKGHWEAIRNMLWDILEAMGEYTSKHYSHNISIEVVPNEMSELPPLD